MSRGRRVGPESELLLYIELEHAEPRIWRRVRVPDTITLVKLHQVIQEAMGWYDCHLHEFVIDHSHYGMVDPNDPGWDVGPELIDEKRKRLLTVLGNRKTFEYIYDYGDSWWHNIRLEKRLPLTGLRPKAFCIDGERACPPEDVGGIPGYFEFLEVINDPTHEEYEDMMTWCGGVFDPRDFNATEVNRRLAQIKL